MPVKKGNLGKTAEDLLTEIHNFYRSRGIASIDQQPRVWLNLKGKGRDAIDFYNKANGNVVAKTRNQQMMYSKKSPVDFAGVVRGRAVYFDAKQTQGKSIPLTNFEVHQIDFVVEKQKHGALAGFMIYFSELDRFFFTYALYVERVFTLAERAKRMQKKGEPLTVRQSIALAQCEEFGREIHKDRLMQFDWVAALFPKPQTEKETHANAERQATEKPQEQSSGAAEDSPAKP